MYAPPFRGDLEGTGEYAWVELDRLEGARLGVTPFIECREVMDAFRSKVGVDDRDWLEGIPLEIERAPGLREFLRLGDPKANRSYEDIVCASGRGELDDALDGDRESEVEMESWCSDRRSSASALDAVALFGDELSSLEAGLPRGVAMFSTSQV